MSKLKNDLRRLLPSSLVNRVFALYSVTLLLFVGGGLALFLNYQFQQQVEESQHSSVMLVEVVALAVQDSVVIGDYDTVRKILDKAVQGSMFTAASFIDLQGGRVRTESRSQPGSAPPAWVVNWVEQQLYDVNRSITVGGKDYGVLRLQFEARDVAANLWSLSVLALSLGLLSLVGGLVLIRIPLTRSLGSLDRLRGLVEDLGTGKVKPDDVATHDAPSEIQSVVDIFNRAAVLVREREASRRALDNQKFALDQHAIVSMTDRRGTITYANDRFCQISGYLREELLGQNHRIIKSECHPRAFYNDLWQTISAGRVWHGDICNRKRSGELYWVNSTVVPLMDEDGRLDQFIAIRTDISERKEAESALIRAKDVAEQANRVKSDFLANMSHEIRTPMNGIIGMTELTLDTDLSVEQRDYLNMVKTSADSLLHIVNEILDFSKIEAGRMDIEHIEFSLGQMLRDSTASLVVWANQKNLDLLLHVAPDVPDQLFGDPGRLRQVIVNLVSNAVKFTHEGEIEVVVSRTKANLEAQAELCFSVRDTGIGIAKENFDVVFDSFSQADTSTTRKYGGTGLGLTISAQLVALMGGGRIGLESKVGQGSTFHFKLRLSVGADDAIMTALGEPLQPSAPLITPHSLRETRRKLNLLLAEDNVVNQALAVRLMQKLGHTVTLVNNGIEAVQHWQTSNFDAILMDIDMPLMNGYEATERIRAHEQANGGHILIVAMTAHAMQGARETCLQHGMDAYLAKPIDTDALWRALDGLMSERGAVLPQTLPLPQTLIVADFVAARQAMDDDRDLFEEIVRLFLRDAPVHMQHIRDGLVQSDSSKVLHSAHTIKGMVGIFAAERSSQAAAQLENMAAQGDLTAGAIVAASELDAAMTELRMEVEIYRLQVAPAWSRIQDQLAPTSPIEIMK